MSVIVILFAVGAGLLIGSRVTAAHDAHERFNIYRTATNSSLGTWLKTAVIAAVSVVVAILLIYDVAVHMNG